MNIKILMGMSSYFLSTLPIFTRESRTKTKRLGRQKKMTSNTVGSHPLYALRGSNPGPID